MQKVRVRGDADVEELSEEEREAVRDIAERVVEHDESLREAIGLSEEFVETMEYFAYRLYESGKYDEAGVLVDAVLALDRRRHYPYLLAGDVALENEQWEEAVQCLGAALEFGPQTPMVEGKLGESLLRVGRLEDAVAHLEAAIEVAEGDDDPYVRRSTVLLEIVAEALADRVSG